MFWLSRKIGSQYKRAGAILYDKGKILLSARNKAITNDDRRVMRRDGGDVRICQRAREERETAYNVWMKGKYVCLSFIGQRDDSVRRTELHRLIIPTSSSSIFNLFIICASPRPFCVILRPSCDSLRAGAAILYKKNGVICFSFLRQAIAIWMEEKGVAHEQGLMLASQQYQRLTGAARLITDKLLTAGLTNIQFV
ncbi:MAG: hypothetical protein UY44_C0002G0012 [Candidatus Kaiserbacteria bacterium GW2011_GWA2_49_19]|uniref:Uncharacterized protein n=1 Tax=Candidatus Kaiserbacteria bacterium GW2011_GWA2_49_19 TaxID=1618669 RepID=A0A0G1Y396_9BACT|nr:MAG: hypothetical protein UY44_C0002G0012 [Candidatus Kaiserbacteria bacterium GW2011_GWA2_49_19]